MPGQHHVKQNYPTPSSQDGAGEGGVPTYVLTDAQEAFVGNALTYAAQVRAAMWTAVKAKSALGQPATMSVLGLDVDTFNHFQAGNNPSRYNLKTGDFYLEGTDDAPTITGGPTLQPPYPGQHR